MMSIIHHNRRSALHKVCPRRLQPVCSLIFSSPMDFELIQHLLLQLPVQLQLLEARNLTGTVPVPT
jgi:hypothetical protein